MRAEKGGLVAELIRNKYTRTGTDIEPLCIALDIAAVARGTTRGHCCSLPTCRGVAARARAAAAQSREARGRAAALVELSVLQLGGTSSCEMLEPQIAPWPRPSGRSRSALRRRCGLPMRPPMRRSRPSSPTQAQCSSGPLPAEWSCAARRAARRNLNPNLALAPLRQRRWRPRRRPATTTSSARSCKCGAAKSKKDGGGAPAVTGETSTCLSRWRSSSDITAHGDALRTPPKQVSHSTQGRPC